MIATPAVNKRNPWLETALRFQGYLGLVIVFLIGLIFSPVRDNSNLFIDPINQANILRDVAETGIIAVGMTFVILVGEIDLSVGSVLALTATFSAAMLVRLKLDTSLVIVLGLAVGGLSGLINGVVTTWVRIPSFVVTLAMMSFARGFARLALGGLAIPVIAGVGGAPEFLCFLATLVWHSRASHCDADCGNHKRHYSALHAIWTTCLRCGRQSNRGAFIGCTGRPCENHSLCDLRCLNRAGRHHSRCPTQPRQPQRWSGLRTERHCCRGDWWYKPDGWHWHTGWFDHRRVDAWHD